MSYIYIYIHTVYLRHRHLTASITHRPSRRRNAGESNQPMLKRRLFFTGRMVQFARTAGGSPSGWFSRRRPVGSFGDQPGRSEINRRQCQVDDLQVPPATRATDVSTRNFLSLVFGVKAVMLTVKSTFARLEGGRGQWVQASSTVN